MSQNRYNIPPTRDVRGTLFNDAITQAKTATSEENSNFSGTIKIMLFVILLLVICSCCLIYFMNDMDYTKIFSSTTVDLLCCINCLTIIGIFLALIFGFHTFSTSESGKQYLDQFYNPNISPASRPLNTNVQNMLENQGTEMQVRNRSSS
jgi:hypothetical protein